jgi:transposase
LIEVLHGYGKPVICAFEATGNYHRPLAWRLMEAGFEVRLVSFDGTRSDTGSPAQWLG